MDGTLYKWGGHFHRWQPRYCVINNGLLEFYNSKESMEKNEGILESHHISSCELNPNKGNATEWTIQAPGQDLVYLKVDLPDERRHWLRLIGSAKACIANTAVLINGGRKISNASHVSVDSSGNDLQHSSPKLKPKDMETYSIDTASISSLSVHDEVKEVDRCIREEATSIDKREEVRETDAAALTSDLNRVCDDLKAELCFIQQNFCSEDTSVSLDALHKDTNKLFQLFKKFSEIVASITKKPTAELKLQEQSDTDDSQSDTVDDHISQHTTDSGYVGTTTTESPQSEIQAVCIPTFFSTVKVSFADVINEANENPSYDLLSSIHSETYMAACICYTKFFDLFAGTLLAPLKADIVSNSEKVRKGFIKNPQRYVYMQPIIEDEIAKKEHLHPDSVTQAVLWMMRGLRTISTFLVNACTPGQPLFKNAGPALEAAYREHLKRYHNFIVQRMFTMGLKFVPGFEHFKKAVVMDPNADFNSRELEEDIMLQAVAYCQCMSEVVRSVEKIYIRHKIDL